MSGLKTRKVAPMQLKAGKENMMKATYVQKGETLDYKNASEEKIEAGTIFSVGKRIGVAGCDILPGETGSIHVEGVFEVTKADKEEIEMGTVLYITESGLTKTEDANVCAGYAAAKSAASDATILVKINA